MPKISIKLDPYGQGWQWSETYLDPYLDEVIFHNCQTDKYGDGLWINNHQVLSTCQYSLPYARASAYSKIRRDIIRRITSTL